MFSSTFTCFVYHSTMHMLLRVSMQILYQALTHFGLKLIEYLLVFIDPNALHAPLGPFNTLSLTYQTLYERLYQCRMRVSMHILEPNHVPLDPTIELTCLSQAPMPELRELGSTCSGPLHIVPVCQYSPTSLRSRGQRKFIYSLLPQPTEAPFKDKIVTEHRTPKRTIPRMQ